MMRRAFFFAILAVGLRLHAATLTAQIDPPVVNVGDEVTVAFTVQGGTISKIVLPTVEGLQVQPGASTTTNITYSAGTLTRSVTQSFRVIPTHSGDFIIPGFDITTADEQHLHSSPLKLKVVVLGTDIAITPPPQAAKPATVTINSAGPVVMPPANPGTDATADADPFASVPKDADGGPAKVFMIVTPETTEAYVGQAIPIQIDFYIREESNADQNSLPTIKGSDFLMNNFSIRRAGTMAVVENLPYERDTWRSAISAPKAGDFPLMIQRDTYWVKSIDTKGNLEPFAGFFGRHQNLAHEMIMSNQLTMHVHALPEEGRPVSFTGAIGQYKVTGSAAPSYVSVGEPIKLTFTINGVGNFDYVRCPALPDDPAWKAYEPTSKTTFFNEACTHAEKVFQQSMVAQKSGFLPLHTAEFSYFDPILKQYISTPITLPEISVNGTATTTSTAALDASTNAPSVTTATPPKSEDFLPNRLQIGSTFADLTPVYRQGWFWIIQAVLLIVAFLGGLFLLLRPRMIEDRGRAERARLHSSRQQEEEAMHQAVQRNDPLAFFVAARHAIQLQLGSQWQVPPEALTLGEIERRDPSLAETLRPLFQQADEIIYSGRAQGPIDLAVWERKVHDVLQPQTANA